MDAAAGTSGWQTYAVTGRPDFLNYLRRGDVTWRQLWDYYREAPADPGAMLRLTGLFHAFLSYDYDREGCILDQDGTVYPALREWARFAHDVADFLPEEKVCEGMAALVGESLISAHYFEAAFNVYLETSLERQPVWMGDLEWLRQQEGFPHAGEQRLRICLPTLPSGPYDGAGVRWEETLLAAIRRHYCLWSAAFDGALGEEEEDWLDEGGEG
jgi:hypothetical protein